MHMLEDHYVEWLHQYYLGAGLMGEQGAAESIHAHLNRLQDRYKNITNGVDKLKYIFEV